MPFLRGGAEILVDDLYQQLMDRGHDVTLFRIPFPNDYGVPLIETVLATKILDFSSYDRVIAFKFPAYCICHRYKTLWMFHQFRQVYELYNEEGGIQDTQEGEAIRDIITEIDNCDIGSAYQVYVNAEEVSNRLRRYNGIPSTILSPPLLNADNYYSDEQGDYLYYPSRVTALKRQHLAIEAMRYVKSNVKLVIAGKCSEPEYETLLYQLIKDYHLENKVQYENRWVDDGEKIAMIAKSLALVYIPYLEDSCGFVTYEGFYSSRPVLTCYDSGGTKEFIEEGVSGYFAEPTPEALAQKMDLLYENREKTLEMGQNAHTEILRRNITWDETVRKLLL